MTPWIRRARFAALGVVLVTSFVAPLSVSAHAEVVDSSPTGGSTVTGSPPIVDATYSENLDPDGSSLVLLDASGATIARGGVPAGAIGAAKKTMSIQSLPTLAPGSYTVKSTTKSADDGDIERTQWTFKVEAAQATASGEPTPVCTDGCNGQSTDAPETPTPTAASTAPSPSDSAPPDTPSTSGDDAIVPIVSALAIVALGGVFLMTRGRRSGTRP